MSEAHYQQIFSPQSESQRLKNLTAALPLEETSCHVQNPTAPKPYSKTCQFILRIRLLSNLGLEMAGGRFRELLRKYGKVGLGVHFSVSAASITGLYVSIKNNVDVQGLFEKVGLSKGEEESGDNSTTTTITTDDGLVVVEEEEKGVKKRNRTAELAASSGGALALAVLLNKALFPIRVPVTLALTPPVARFLRSRHIIKNGL